MENIDRISILDARGLHVDANGGDAGIGAGQSNLADAAVAAAMRHRVGGPLIDGLMAELGMTGASLNGMLAGSATPASKLPDGSPAAAASLAKPRIKPANGNGDTAAVTSN